MKGFSNWGKAREKMPLKEGELSSCTEALKALEEEVSSQGSDTLT